MSTKHVYLFCLVFMSILCKEEITGIDVRDFKLETAKMATKEERRMEKKDKTAEAEP